MTDLLLSGGDVLDPGQGLRGKLDVAVDGEAIAEIAPWIEPGPETRVLDVLGKLVVPGLVDLHAHVYDGVNETGLPADVAGVMSGVTTLLDAGSAGCVNFAGAAERVFFIEPTDGADITSPVRVKMGTEGLIVRRKFEPQKRYGHHHLFVDDASIPEMDDRIPAPDDTHIHFHQIEEETVLKLAPGQHTLTLLFGDGHDFPYNPILGETITVNVVGEQRIYFVEPEDDAQIREFPFKVRLGSEGLEGSTGHYVVIWDKYPFPPEGQPVPIDDQTVHLEPGQTEFDLDIKAGGHPFHVIFVDENNRLTDPPLSDSIDIAVWKADVKIETGKDGLSPG